MKICRTAPAAVVDVSGDLKKEPTEVGQERATTVRTLKVFATVRTPPSFPLFSLCLFASSFSLCLFASSLMITILRMRMIMHTAGAVIDKVCSNDQPDGWYEQPGFIMGEKLLQYQEYKPCQEDDDGNKTVMMLPVTMVKRPGANTKSKKDHPCLEINIMNNINSKKRDT